MTANTGVVVCWIEYCGKKHCHALLGDTAAMHDWSTPLEQFCMLKTYWYSGRITPTLFTLGASIKYPASGMQRVLAPGAAYFCAHALHSSQCTYAASPPAEHPARTSSEAPRMPWFSYRSVRMP